MRVLKAFGLAIATLTVGILILVLLAFCGLFIDVYALGWFGLPTEDGYGFAIAAVLFALVMYTLMFLATD